MDAVVVRHSDIEVVKNMAEYVVTVRRREDLAETALCNGILPPVSGRRIEVERGMVCRKNAAIISKTAMVRPPFDDVFVFHYKPEVAKENFMKSGNRDDGWLTGRLYFNREDKRVIIKRPRSGFGYTMNLGNKWTWIFNETVSSFV